MPGLSTPDPAIANAGYMELRTCVGWLFADDAPETLESRRRALTRIDELRPATTTEASFAAQVVALDLHRQDSLRLAAEHRDDVATAIKCRNNANSLSRQSQRTQAKLEAMQQARRMRGVRWDPATHRFTAQDPPALTAVQPDESAPNVATPRPLAPSSELVAPPSDAAKADPLLDGGFPQHVMARAERYAIVNRQLATRIRRAGGLTPQAVAGFRPSAYPKDEETVCALVFGHSDILDALDRPEATRKAA